VKHLEHQDGVQQLVIFQWLAMGTLMLPIYFSLANNAEPFESSGSEGSSWCSGEPEPLLLSASITLGDLMREGGADPSPQNTRFAQRDCCFAWSPVAGRAARLSDRVRRTGPTAAALAVHAAALAVLRTIASPVRNASAAMVRAVLTAPADTSADASAI
jgi:hypothetical protein